MRVTPMSLAASSYPARFTAGSDGRVPVEFVAAPDHSPRTCHDNLQTL
jgi:hypothetical protein